MSETLPDQTNLKSQYASQVAGDLERNVKEQERIASEVESLQRQLLKLEEDRVLLVSIEQALATEADAPKADAVQAPAATPRSAKTARLPRSRKPKDAEESAAGKGKQTKAKQTKQSKGPAKSARKAGAPTLRELVAQRLAEQHEARSAAEVTSDLAQAHADREFSVTVVRNTLEGLVAKGQALRTKQRRSVFYSEPSAGSTGSEQPQELAKAEV